MSYEPELMVKFVFEIILICDYWLCTAAFFGASFGEIKFINCEYWGDIFDILKCFGHTEVSWIWFWNLV